MSEEPKIRPWTDEDQKGFEVAEVYGYVGAISMISPESIAKGNSEFAEQSALLCWCAMNKDKYPELDMLVHVPNGGSRNKAEAARLKISGVKAGYPDLILDVPRGPYHGLRIEMKYGKGKLSCEQIKWAARLHEQGYRVEVCYTWRSAAEVLLSYLTQLEIIQNV